MRDDFSWPLLCGVVIIGMAVLFIVALITETSRTSTDAYRQGQIDAINGKIMYELKQLPTGETAWGKASE